MIRSFIEVKEDSHFPIQNIPFGIFSTQNEPDLRVGTAIGEYVLDLKVLSHAGLFENVPEIALKAKDATLNAFMAQGKPVWTATRNFIQKLLSSETPTLRDNTALREAAFIPLSQVKMHLPAAIGDYTDFYASKEHATNVGIMFRGKDNALQPNWKHLPVGYHGRASNLVDNGAQSKTSLLFLEPAQD
ncbi:hypothetical protein L0F63_001288 [Massospora cicadina]|nr:hypothetical protein L0F63_001288 [Massospora cicadina]